jgi:hypothetical protein
MTQVVNVVDKSQFLQEFQRVDAVPNPVAVVPDWLLSRRTLNTFNRILDKGALLFA